METKHSPRLVLRLTGQIMPRLVITELQNTIMKIQLNAEAMRYISFMVRVQ